jgi:hypothetical protein
VNADALQRVGHEVPVSRPRETNEHDIAAKLTEDPRDVASLPARLHDRLLAPLDQAGFEIADLKDAVYGEIGTNDQQHLKQKPHEAPERQEPLCLL